MFIFQMLSFIFYFKQVEGRGCGLGDVPKRVSQDVFDQASPKTADGKCIYECMLRATGNVRTFKSFKLYT